MIRAAEKYRAVIFDLDGTLLDTLQDIAESTNAALLELGFAGHPVAHYRDLVGAGVERLVHDALPAAVRDDEGLVQQGVRKMRALYAARLDRCTRPYPGIAELLDGLGARGVPLAVLSNKPDELTRALVASRLAPWFFEAVRGALPAVPHKPDPGAALELARQLELTPAEIIFAGDSGIDMRTARSAGMLAVGVLWGLRPAAELREAGAQVLIETPPELLDLL